MPTVTRSSTTKIAVLPEVVWRELDTNFLGLSAWAGGVTSSQANPATPSGMNGSAHGGRICDVSGVGVADERLVHFDAAARTMSYSVQAEGLPFFVTGLQNTWTVHSDGEAGSVVHVDMAAFTQGIFGRLGALPLGRMLAKAAVGLPGDLKSYLEHAAASSPAGQTPAQ